MLILFVLKLKFTTDIALFTAFSEIIPRISTNEAQYLFSYLNI